MKNSVVFVIAVAFVLALAACSKQNGDARATWFYQDAAFMPGETISFWMDGKSSKPVACHSIADLLNELSVHGWICESHTATNVLVKRAKAEDAPNFQILP